MTSQHSPFMDPVVPTVDPEPGVNVWSFHQCPPSPATPRPHGCSRALVECEWPNAVIVGRGSYIAVVDCGEVVEVEATRSLQAAQARRDESAAACDPDCSHHRVALVMLGAQPTIVWQPSS